MIFLKRLFLIFIHTFIVTFLLWLIFFVFHLWFNPSSFPIFYIMQMDLLFLVENVYLIVFVGGLVGSYIYYRYDYNHKSFSWNNLLVFVLFLALFSFMIQQIFLPIAAQKDWEAQTKFFLRQIYSDTLLQIKNESQYAWQNDKTKDFYKNIFYLYQDNLQSLNKNDDMSLVIRKTNLDLEKNMMNRLEFIKLPHDPLRDTPLEQAIEKNDLSFTLNRFKSLTTQKRQAIQKQYFQSWLSLKKRGTKIYSRSIDRSTQKTLNSLYAAFLEKKYSYVYYQLLSLIQEKPFLINSFFINQLLFKTKQILDQNVFWVNYFIPLFKSFTLNVLDPSNSADFLYQNIMIRQTLPDNNLKITHIGIVLPFHTVFILKNVYVYVYNKKGQCLEYKFTPYAISYGGNQYLTKSLNIFFDDPSLKYTTTLYHHYLGDGDLDSIWRLPENFSFQKYFLDSYLLSYNELAWSHAHLQNLKDWGLPYKRAFLSNFWSYFQIFLFLFLFVIIAIPITKLMIRRTHRAYWLPVWFRFLFSLLFFIPVSFYFGGFVLLFRSFFIISFYFNFTFFYCMEIIIPILFFVGSILILRLLPFEKWLLVDIGIDNME